MKDLQHFTDFVNEINAENGRLYKQNILRKYKDDEVIKQFLKFSFDPFIVFGISSRKFNKEVVVDDIGLIPMSPLQLVAYLSEHNTGRDVDIAVAQKACENLPIELSSALQSIIFKEVSIGCDAKTINKEIPNLISTFSVQLAQKYFDNPERLIGKSFAITEKLDGCRIIVIKDSSGSVNFYSRVGQQITGLVELEEEMQKLPNNICFDGEITISNYSDMPSGDAYKLTTKIVRKDGEKRGLTMRIFDGMAASDFLAQSCALSYSERREMLEALFANDKFNYFEVLPILYRGDDVSKVTLWLDSLTDKGAEGCMINVLDAPYQWNRTWNLMKVKKFSSLDLLVVGMQEGEGRLAGTLGTIQVRYKEGNIVSVGSGFSDAERTLYWNNPELILNKIVEIKYFAESYSKDSSGKTLYSLRFPTWCSNIRDAADKDTPDF